MTIEMQLKPEERPRVEDAWEHLRDLHEVLEARTKEVARLLTFHVVISRPTIEEPVIPIAKVQPTRIVRRSRDELQEELERFETAYGFSTAELIPRLRAGEMEETLDVRRWVSLRAIHNRINP